MSTYTIQEFPLGTFALMLGTQLIIQATERADCERVKHTLQNSNHAEHATQTGDIQDGIGTR